MAIVTGSPKTLFIHIPKTGGTSVTKWLRNNTVGSKKDIGKHSKMNEHDIGDGVFVYTMVRHPYNRVISGYNFHCAHTIHQFKGSFIDWWESDLSEISRESQSAYVTDRLDYFIKLEKQKFQFKKIMQMFKSKVPLDQHNKSGRDKKYPEFWRANIPQNIQREIHLIHKDDFDRFGYEVY